MLNKLTFLVGARYGISRRHSQLVSFISSLSIASLVIGVALLVLVMSIMNGFDRELRERILGIMPQATIYQRYGIEEPQPLIDELESHPQVLAAAPFVQLQGLLAHQKRVSPVNLFGIDPAQEARWQRVDQLAHDGGRAEQIIYLQADTGHRTGKLRQGRGGFQSHQG